MKTLGDHTPIDTGLRRLRREEAGIHVRDVGFELEGGMHRHEMKRLEEHVANTGYFAGYYDHGYEDGLNVNGKGERNLEVKFWSPDYGVVVDVLRYAYAKCGFATNHRCGFHVHMTFEDMPKAVSFFSSVAVQNEFRFEYERQFAGSQKYLGRLTSEHCRHDNVHGLSVSGKVLYVGPATISLLAYPTHGTIEFRILPNQESWIEAVRGLEWLVRTVDRMYEIHGGVAADSVLAPEKVREDRMLRQSKRGL